MLVDGGSSRTARCDADMLARRQTETLVSVLDHRRQRQHVDRQRHRQPPVPRSPTRTHNTLALVLVAYTTSCHHQLLYAQIPCLGLLSTPHGILLNVTHTVLILTRKISLCREFPRATNSRKIEQHGVTSSLPACLDQN